MFKRSSLIAMLSVVLSAFSLASAGTANAAGYGAAEDYNVEISCVAYFYGASPSNYDCATYQVGSNSRNALTGHGYAKIVENRHGKYVVVLRMTSTETLQGTHAYYQTRSASHNWGNNEMAVRVPLLYQLPTGNNGAEENYRLMYVYFHVLDSTLPDSSNNTGGCTPACG